MGGYAPGTLVRARDREWVVLPASEPDFLVLRPLGGDEDDVTAVFPALEPVTGAQFAPPTSADLGDAASATLLRQALRIGFRASAGPFRSLASLAVEPRSYQLVPLLLALRSDVVRLLIADDVGIGKTVEAGLIAVELLAQGDARGLTVLCSPALAEQWRGELASKFGIDAELVLPATVTRLQRGLGMDESLFDRHPHTVVSTDFIKSPTRRDEFLRTAPDLVIVDEAHTCVSGSGGAGGRSRTQRHELLRRLAADDRRHLLLVTATPHSGAEEGFRNLLELLDPVLLTVDLNSSAGRDRLARHFVQRRRGDIRRYLDQDTPFPRDRVSQERPYGLTPGYAALLDRVLDYTRESVRNEAGGPLQHRVRWWSALALLRALASSPKAAAATLRARAAGVAAVTPEEADSLGRAAVLDLGTDEALEMADATPGADPEATATDSTEHRRLLGFARDADRLAGPGNDAKLVEVTKVVSGLLADGFDPIVFCRFIDTAEYVARHLTTALGKSAHVGCVTGQIAPTDRVTRIAELTATGARSVLVATDCLSEGVNLQERFQAVVHYDLAWNPTRHEQREGRVDRFGQTADVVRAVTIYGRDNRIDGVVLDVLLRKHLAIRAATGVSVPVPEGSDAVVEAMLEGLLLRGSGYDAGQLELDGIADTARRNLDVAWESAAAKEKASRTKYAQSGIRPDEVAQEIARTRAALGAGADVEAFVRETLGALGAPLTDVPDGFAAPTATLPPALRHALTGARRDPLVFRRTPPVTRSQVLLARTDPDIESIAAFVLDAALDPTALPGDLGRRLARRAGVFRSPAVSARTTVLLLRHRVHLTLPGREQVRSLVAEDAEIVAFTGRPEEPAWLPPAAVEELLAAPAAATGADRLTADALDRARNQVAVLAPALDARGDALADRLLADHLRVRATAGGMARRGLTVEPIRPADVLGLYLCLPAVPA